VKTRLWIFTSAFLNLPDEVIGSQQGWGRISPY